MGVTIARDWFKTVEEFRQVCLDAVSLARSERAQEFAQEKLRDANRIGLDTVLSDRQLAWLCSLADIVPPLKITP